MEWLKLRALSKILLALLTVVIHLVTLLMAPASFVGFVFAFLLP